MRTLEVERFFRACQSEGLRTSGMDNIKTVSNFHQALYREAVMTVKYLCLYC